MKFTVQSDAFLQTFLRISKALPGRVSLPILQNVLFEVMESSVRLTATNLDFSIQEEIPVDEAVPGRFTLPGKTLTNFLQSLQPTLLRFEHEERVTRILTSTGQYSLIGLSPDDFPSIQEIESGEEIEFERALVQNAVSYVSFCTAREEQRTFLTGVLWQVTNNETRFVASDAHRLALVKIPGETSVTFDAILPRNSFDFLRDRDEEKFRVRYGGNTIGFYFENGFLISRLLEGPYPAYENVIPKETGSVLEISKEEFLSSLKRISIFTPAPTHLVKITLSREEQVLEASSPEVGEGAEKLLGSYDGEDVQLGFNVQYLTEIVRHLPGETISLHVYDPLAATKLEGEAREDGIELFYLLMPVKIE